MAKVGGSIEVKLSSGMLSLFQSLLKALKECTERISKLEDRADDNDWEQETLWGNEFRKLRGKKPHKKPMGVINLTKRRKHV